MMSTCTTVAATAALLMVSQLATAVPVTQVAASDDVQVIADFNPEDKSHVLNWAVENDPVMGGASTSTLTPNPSESTATWQGHVRIVPFLGAAGFCTVRGSGGSGIPDISMYTDLVFVLKTVPSKTNLTNFQAQFESSTRSTEKGGGFIADFTLTPGETQVVVPFSKFVESWRGEKIGGAPSLKQLQTIEQIGVGSDGRVGEFDVEIQKIFASNGAPNPPPAPPSSAIPLVSFAKGGNYQWHVVNDPVMGGLSTSKFTDENGVGVFEGTVRIVPSLKAPGFCNAEAVAPFGKGMPKVGETLSGGIEITLSNLGNVTAFKFAFGTRSEYDFGSYKADFTVAASQESRPVYIPYNHFSNKWSASTGEPTTKCSEDPRVCPTAAALNNIGSLGVWAEGTAGYFKLEIQSIDAVTK